MPFEYETGRIYRKITCVLSANRFICLKLTDSIINRSRKSGYYWKFDLSGILNYSPDGIVFGELKYNE